MIILAIKIIIFFFIFAHSVFAESNDSTGCKTFDENELFERKSTARGAIVDFSCDMECQIELGLISKENTSSYYKAEKRYTNKGTIFKTTSKITGMIQTYKDIAHPKGSCEDGSTNERREKIVTIHDSICNLLFSKHYTYIGKMLVQTIDNGVVRNIIPGKTPCKFTIIEPSGDSIFFNFEPENELDIFIGEKDNENFTAFLYGSSLFLYGSKDSIFTTYDAIKYEWRSLCKSYHEMQKQVKYSSDSVFLNMAKEQKSNYFLSYILLYKYYGTIIVGVIATIATIRYKKLKKGKNCE